MRMFTQISDSPFNDQIKVKNIWDTLEAAPVEDKMRETRQDDLVIYKKDP